MNLQRLLFIHAMILFGAGIVLIASPDQILRPIGIWLKPEAYLTCYLLGAAELAMAFLSYFSRGIQEVRALRLVCITFVLFHMLTAFVELYAIAQGASLSVLINVGLRCSISGLFAWYALRKRIEQ